MTSSFEVKVVRIEKMEKHPNADALSIVDCGWPCIIKTIDFKVGDKAVYIPPDAKLPDTPEWAWMKKSNSRMVVKPIKLRGVYSQGILAPLPDSSWEVGEDVAERMGITKYIPPEPLVMGEEFIPDVPGLPKYTDIDNYQKYKHVLREDEMVVITEKVHGSNCRVAVWDGADYVGSHRMMLKDTERNTFWNVARRLGLHQKLRERYGGRNVVLFGELVGQGVQTGYDYGFIDRERTILAFDIFDGSAGRYLEYPDFEATCAAMGVSTVPLLYRNPWHAEECIKSFVYGKDTIVGKHVREGIVIRAVPESYDLEVGRKVLKYKSEDFESQKNLE